jgi:hypothetical protein
MRVASDTEGTCRARVVRIEWAFYEEMEARADLKARVGQIYENGLDLVADDGFLIYVGTGRWLTAPFAVIIDRPVKEWAALARIDQGDAFHRQGEWLIRVAGNGCSISLKPSCIVDLSRPILPITPCRDSLLGWVRLLIGEILKGGRFEGMAGTLHFLRDSLPEEVPWSSFPVSFWSRQALPFVTGVVHSVLSNDADQFERAWGALLGLGPGLTPGGDDLLVGFLAAHRLFSSPFAQELQSDPLKSRLKETARSRTTLPAARFLSAALDGRFSEIVYRFLHSLDSTCENGESGQVERTEAAETLIGFGHTSGTDLLAGVAIGFWTMALTSL